MAPISQRRPAGLVPSATNDLGLQDVPYEFMSCSINHKSDALLKEWILEVVGISSNAKRPSLRALSGTHEGVDCFADVLSLAR